MSAPQVISSPCIGVCVMSEVTGLCQGCSRTIDEIQQWWDMSDAQRQQIMQVLEARQADNIDFGD